MKKFKTVAAMILALSMMSTAMPVAANALYSTDSGVAQTEEATEINYFLWFEDIDDSVADRKAAYAELNNAMLDKLVEEIGIARETAICSKYTSSIGCHLTDEQLEKAKKCDFIVSIESAVQTTTSGDDVTSVPSVSEDEQATQEYEITFKDVDDSVSDKKSAYEEIAKMILSELGIDGADVICSKYNPSFVYALTDEQAVKAKTCELVTNIQMAAPSYPANDESGLTPSYPENDESDLTPSYPENDVTTTAKSETRNI